MLSETVWIGVVSLGILVLAILLTGHFTRGHWLVKPLRHTVHRGIRVKAYARLSPRPRHRGSPDG